MKTENRTKQNSIWASLTDEQKDEIMLAYNESENEKNLIEASVVLNNINSATCADNLFARGDNSNVRKG